MSLTDTQIEALFRLHFPRTKVSAAWFLFAREVEKAVGAGGDAAAGAPLTRTASGYSGMRAGAPETKS